MIRCAAVLALLALSGCSTLPRKHDPEGCDRVEERVKQAGSDLVIDGDLHCPTDVGDCVLAPARVIVGKVTQQSRQEKIPVHILRKEADDYSKVLTARNEIAFCYPAELWFPSEGTYRGRFYLRREAGGQYKMAFYPRIAKEY